MSLTERLGLTVLQQLDPERAHGLAVRALKMGLVKGDGPVTSPRLAQRIAGLDLPNPVGLAAGFDKNAEVLAPLSQQGFGFLEVGAVTPIGQQGNPAPRLFRLTEDAAVINRFGFNNEGADAVLPRLQSRPRNIPIGLNLGANKDSEDRAADYVSVLTSCGPHVDFVTVNVSSPNTQNLRDLQGKAALWALLAGVLNARAKLEHPLPVFLKIAPDLDDEALADIAAVATESSLDAIIATNTTVERPASLRSAHREETGGLSGAPLFEPSTRVLAKLYEATRGKVPLIGVGGIASAADAYAKIGAGASAVQLYSALVYQGMSLVPRIAHKLEDLLQADGFDTVADAVGSDRHRWLA